MTVQLLVILFKLGGGWRAWSNIWIKMPDRRLDSPENRLRDKTLWIQSSHFTDSRFKISGDITKLGRGVVIS